MPVKMTFKRDGFVCNAEFGEILSETRMSIAVTLPVMPELAIYAHVLRENGEYIPAVEVSNQYLKGKAAGYYADMLECAHSLVNRYAEELNIFEESGSRYVTTIKDSLKVQDKEKVALYLPLAPICLSNHHAYNAIGAVVNSTGLYGEMNTVHDLTRFGDATRQGLMFLAELANDDLCLENFSDNDLLKVLQKAKRYQ